MTYDAIVIGASFAGLSGAMQLARARRSVAVIDAGAPRNRFSPASHGFLGQDGRPPFAIMAEGRRELERYPSVTFIDGEAIRVERTNDGFDVGLAVARTLAGKRLILAMGIRDELPAIAGLQERWGSYVLHCPYCHGYEFGSHKLGVLASGPMSVHQALLVADWGPTTFFTNNSFEPDSQQRDKLTKRGIQIVTAAISELSGTSDTLQAVRMGDGVMLPLDALFLAPRTHMTSDIPKQLGCQFDEAPTGVILRVDGSKTTVPGVYAAGDMSSPMWNATLAAAAGVGAGVAAHQSLIFE